MEDAGYARHDPAEIPVACDPGPESGPDEQERLAVIAGDRLLHQLENRVSHARLSSQSMDPEALPAPIAAAAARCAEGVEAS